jgi:hypothetical protein
MVGITGSLVDHNEIHAVKMLRFEGTTPRFMHVRDNRTSRTDERGIAGGKSTG